MPRLRQCLFSRIKRSGHCRNCSPTIISVSSVIPSSVVIHGFTELGYSSNHTGTSTVPTMVLHLPCTNRPILPSERGGSVDLSANAAALTGSVLPNNRYPYLPLRSGYHHLYRLLQPGLGAPNLGTYRYH